MAANLKVVRQRLKALRGDDIPDSEQKTQIAKLRLQVLKLDKIPNADQRETRDRLRKIIAAAPAVSNTDDIPSETTAPAYSTPFNGGGSGGISYITPAGDVGAIREALGSDSVLSKWWFWVLAFALVFGGIYFFRRKRNA